MSVLVCVCSYVFVCVFLCVNRTADREHESGHSLMSSSEDEMEKHW